MKLAEALREGASYLRSRQIAEASLDAWYLLEFCTDLSRTQYFLHQDEEMEKEQETRYLELLQKRGTRIPLQYLTGSQFFMGLEFAVNKDVLIPRQDTEVLVGEALKKIKPGNRVLDLCTGSGCIAVSLSVLAKGSLVCASDISEKALQVAEKNAARHQADVTFIQSDLFEQIKGTFDCMVSNPPYIRSDEIPGLMPEVFRHEPLLALDGKGDGLYFYRRIIAGASAHLNPSGWLMFEIGYDQGEDVCALMRDAGYEEIEKKKDLAGLDRVVLGRRPKEERDV